MFAQRAGLPSSRPSSRLARDDKRQTAAAARSGCGRISGWPSGWKSQTIEIGSVVYRTRPKGGISLSSLSLKGKLGKQDTFHPFACCRPGLRRFSIIRDTFPPLWDGHVTATTFTDRLRVLSIIPSGALSRVAKNQQRGDDAMARFAARPPAPAALGTFPPPRRSNASQRLLALFFLL